jgi:hypothetical protein
MSIALICPSCCICPTPIEEWDSRSYGITKSGFVDNSGYQTEIPNGIRYLSMTVSGSLTCNSYAPYDPDWYETRTSSGTVNVDPVSGRLLGLINSCYSSTNHPTPFCEGISLFSYNTPLVVVKSFGSIESYCSLTDETPTQLLSSTSSPPNAGNNNIPITGSVTATVSNEYTTDLLKSLTFSNLPNYDNSWNDTPGNFSYLNTDETTYYLRESRYRFRFKVPKTNTGRNYYINWVERFIPQSGVGVTSVEVYSRGVYRPSIYFITSPSTVIPASAVAVMSPTGRVSSIRILNPGKYIPIAVLSGGGGTGASVKVLEMGIDGSIQKVEITGGQNYESAPIVSWSSVTTGQVRATATLSILKGVVTSISFSNRGDYRPRVAFSPAVSGGTTATANAASLNTSGQITEITIDTAGNYLPILLFSTPSSDGVTATATCTLDEQGGIDSVTLTNAGSEYTVEPSITIISQITIPIKADLLLHLGTEIIRCANWDGKTLTGKWVYRIIDEVGHPLSSISMAINESSGFTYAPTISVTPPESIAVTISAPPTGGIQAIAQADVNRYGQVTSITLLERGSGYTTPPSITVLEPGTGGTQSTGWIAAITSGKVTSITGGTPGDYSIAATASLDSSGKISQITLTKKGAGFKTQPRVVLGYSRGPRALLAVAHFGTETEYGDGTEPPNSLPVGYVEDAVETYPILGSTGTAPLKYYGIPIPSSNGTTLIANIRAKCDSSSCQ